MPEKVTRIATTAEALYLLNLLFPLLPWLVLLAFNARHRESDSFVVRAHLRQAVIAATITTSLFLVANLVVPLVGGYKSIGALILFEIYYIVVVPVSLIPGLFGLIRAMAGESYRFPLIGKYAGVA